MGRFLELFVLFGLVPLAIVPIRRDFGPFLIPSLLGLAGLFLFVLLRDKTFDRKQLGFGSGTANSDQSSSEAPRSRSPFRRILTTFLIGAPLTGLLTAWLRPDLLFAFPREQTTWWLAVCVLYPLLSVLPQEILFRTFFFHRYEPILKGGFTIAASALSFGLAHVFFGNWIATILSAVGGWLFASTYAATRSTFAAGLEHALWGNWLFTVGLGWFFWSGSIG